MEEMVDNRYLKRILNLKSPEFSAVEERHEFSHQLGRKPLLLGIIGKCQSIQKLREKKS